MKILNVRMNSAKEKLKYFIINITLIVYGELFAANVLFSSIYIKKIDLYIPQYIFVPSCIIFFLVFAMVNAITSKHKSIDALQIDSIIPLGLACMVFLAQYSIELVIGICIIMIMLISFKKRIYKIKINYFIAMIMALSLMVSFLCAALMPKVYKTEKNAETQDVEFHLISNKEWNNYNIDERLTFLQKLAEYECNRLGCNITEISAKVLPEKANYYEAGNYSKKNDRIYISIRALQSDDYETTMKDVIHEVRHRYQSEVVKYADQYVIKSGKTDLKMFKDINEWGESMDDYTSYKKDERDYHNEAIEMDCREYAEFEVWRIKKLGAWF